MHNVCLTAREWNTECVEGRRRHPDVQESRQVWEAAAAQNLKLHRLWENKLQKFSANQIRHFERNVHQPNINALLEIHQRDSGSCTVLTEYSVLNNNNNKIRKGNVPFDIHKQVTISNTRQPLPNQGPGHWKRREALAANETMKASVPLSSAV